MAGPSSGLSPSGQQAQVAYSPCDVTHTSVNHYRTHLWWFFNKCHHKHVENGQKPSCTLASLSEWGPSDRPVNITWSTSGRPTNGRRHQKTYLGPHSRDRSGCPPRQLPPCLDRHNPLEWSENECSVVNKWTFLLLNTQHPLPLTNHLSLKTLPSPSMDSKPMDSFKDDFITFPLPLIPPAPTYTICSHREYTSNLSMGQWSHLPPPCF